MAENEKNPYITQHDFLPKLADLHGLSKREMYEIYNEIQDEIIGALGDGKEVHLTRFITFAIDDRGPRKARNPHSGEPVEVPAKRVIKPRNKKRLYDAYLQLNNLN